MLTNTEINEIADAPPGEVKEVMEGMGKYKNEPKDVVKDQAAVKIHVASVGTDGRVSFQDAKNLKDFEK